MPRCQGVRRDGKPCKASATRGSTYCRMHISQDGTRRLTRREVLRMIENNGGPGGLDLSGRDLSGIDLSSDAIKEEIERIGFPYDNPPAWYSTMTGGINLCGAILKDANFRGARLWRADFREVDLRRAQLQKADLGVSLFAEANLREANLERAILSRADVEGADLGRANLTSTVIQGVDLSVAKSLEGIYLCGVNLDGTMIAREQLRTGIGEEQDKHYYRAKEAYPALKNNFLSLGRYDDASWAFIRERQMARKAQHPMRARRFYGGIELPETTRPLSASVWSFYVRHTVGWLIAWMAELSCGYGEKPLRTILWAVAVILTFPFFYQWSDGLSITTGCSPQWIDYLHHSLAAFSTMSLPDIAPVGDWAKLLTSIEAILGISVLALLMFALGNRIGRS